MKIDKKTRIILAVALPALLIVLGLVIFDYVKKSPQTLLKVMAEHVDLQVKDVVYTDVGQSGEKWEIRADTVRYLKKENLAVFEKVNIKLMTKDGRTFRMSGAQGKLQTDTKNMEISGNVEVISDRGERFRTEVLHYANAQSIVYTDGAVTMWGDKMRIRGNGMTLNLKQGELNIASGVKGQLQQK